MRFTSLLGLSVLAALAAACAPKADSSATNSMSGAPVALSATELEAVRAVDAAFAAGINAKDTTAVFAVYASDAKVMPPDSPILEGTAGHPDIAALISGGATDMVLNTTTAYGVGDLAYMVGTASFKMAGSAQTVKYAEVLRKGADGKWRYVVDMFSGVVAPVPVAPKH
ncbi:MAG: hypothetical protein JWO05_2788 [Gemmatimonadetes bacterium]|nr:hypothetical protein [Gemmatimonadota bacterium]